MTKKMLIEYVRMCEYNQETTEEALRQQAENLKGLRPERTEPCKFCNGTLALYQRTTSTDLYINTCNGASALYTKVDGCPEKHFGCALQHIPTESTFRIYFCPNCGRRLMYEDDGSGIGQTFSP